jgi:hypothetical protein
MWLIGSMPSNPAAFTALNLSSTEPLTPTVAYMIPFLIFRFFGAGSASAATTGTAGVRAARVTAPALTRRNSRRFRSGLMLSIGCRAAVVSGH